MYITKEIFSHKIVVWIFDIEALMFESNAYGRHIRKNRFFEKRLSENEKTISFTYRLFRFKKTFFGCHSYLHQIQISKYSIYNF
jgi:hypothetical protein